MKNVAFVILLSVMVIASRIPFRSEYLYSWDSISFALSVDHYDMTLHQPHPPGYILYSGTLRLLNPLFGDPNLVMIWLSIVATIGGAFFLALLVRNLSGKDSMLLPAGAAALYITNPISWFYGCVAEIYALEGFFVALIAYLIVASRNRSPLLLWASVVMGLAGGFRLTTEVFLIPFYLVGFRGKDRRTVVSSIGLLLISNLVWLAPLSWHTGGIQKYVQMLQDQTARAAEQTLTAEAEGDENPISGRKIPFRLFQILTLPILFLLLIRIHRIRFTSQEMILLLILLPPLAMFTFVHFPKDGYLLFIIPVLLALVAVSMGRLYRSRAAIASAFVLASALNCALFLGSDRLPSFVQETAHPNLRILQTRMARFETFFRTIEDRMGTDPKIFIMGTRHYFPSWRTILYYYPDNEILLLGPKRQRAFLGLGHKYDVVRPPFPLRPDIWLIIVGEREPQLPLNEFQVDSYSYYYSRTNELPKRFELYSMVFRVLRP